MAHVIAPTGGQITPEEAPPIYSVTQEPPTGGRVMLGLEFYRLEYADPPVFEATPELGPDGDSLCPGELRIEGENIGRW